MSTCEQIRVGSTIRDDNYGTARIKAISGIKLKASLIPQIKTFLILSFFHYQSSRKLIYVIRYYANNIYINTHVKSEFLFLAFMSLITIIFQL